MKDTQNNKNRLVYKEAVSRACAAIITHWDDEQHRVGQTWGKEKINNEKLLEKYVKILETYFELELKD